MYILRTLRVVLIYARISKSLSWTINFFQKKYGVFFSENVNNLCTGLLFANVAGKQGWKENIARKSIKGEN